MAHTSRVANTLLVMFGKDIVNPFDIMREHNEHVERIAKAEAVGSAISD